MSEYKIEKNIPLPQSSMIYPVLKMEVGDSFFIPCADAEYQIEGGRIRSRLQHEIRHCHPKRTMSVRRVPGGYRVWRIV